MTEVGAAATLQLQEIAEPEILLPTQIKVKLQAAGVNPIDTKIRGGGLLQDGGLPAVLGCDGAGEVMAVGDQVKRFKIGDRVWFCHGGMGGDQGNYAQYNVINQRWLAKMPESVTYTDAAAGPLVLITAWGGLYDRGGLQAGQTVLIHAGAGGVGHVAIQLAKLKGARVITTVSSEAKVEFVKKLGADEVIDYRQENFVERVNELTDGQGADLVFDTVSPEVFTASIEATAHFGSIVTLLDPGNFNIQEARMRHLKIGFELMLTPMLRSLDKARDKHIDILEQCAQWIDSDKLKLEVSQVLPLQEAAKAHEIIEQGHSTGKIVLTV
jgi:NADPH2:quinone reductase